MDTRSDIYSLGVLLYELLTGTTLFDRQRFATAAYDEIRRIIREEDPPKPSRRLSTRGDTLSKVSANRETEPAKLPSIVAGDLDWIVMKALEKDRTAGTKLPLVSRPTSGAIWPMNRLKLGPPRPDTVYRHSLVGIK